MKSRTTNSNNHIYYGFINSQELNSTVFSFLLIKNLAYLRNLIIQIYNVYVFLVKFNAKVQEGKHSVLNGLSLFAGQELTPEADEMCMGAKYLTVDAKNKDVLL